VHKQVVMKYT